MSFRMGIISCGKRCGKQIFVLVALLAMLIPIGLKANSDGAIPEHTGGFGDGTCVECHGTTVLTTPGSVTITAPATYRSGETYQISVRVADPNRNRWGFQLSSRTATGQQAGGLSRIDTTTRCASGAAAANPCGASSNGIQYITHTLASTRPGTTTGATFTFNWTAPNTSAGPVVFHAAGNAANNNNQADLNDRIYTTSFTSQPQVAGPVPTVADGATVNNGSFALHPAPLGPGSIAAIFGSNLNNGNSLCGSSFGADGKLITSICGSTVTFDGVAAPMFFSSPGQLAVQVPYEMAGKTTASVVVTVDGQASTPRTVFIDAAAPGIFTTNQQGSGQGAVLIANSDILAAPTGSIAGRNTRPARRGEIVTVFLTGLGVTSPALGTGVPSGGQTTATAATVTIDGLPAQVLFSGTAPGFVGLNQINVTVPATATIGNSVPVVVTLGGKVGNTVTMAVSQ
jgi:uncharacterized protein (TIGR03437 family)